MHKVAIVMHAVRQQNHYASAYTSDFGFLISFEPVGVYESLEEAVRVRDDTPNSFVMLADYHRDGDGDA